jgi:hypothetical protein
MLAQYIAQRQLVRAHLRNRMSGSSAITASAQQPRAQPHGRTAHEPDVGLSRSPRATVATHAGRAATLDRHVSIESWEEELVGRQPSVSVRRAAGSSSITPWKRSSAGEHGLLVSSLGDRWFPRRRRGDASQRVHFVAYMHDEAIEGACVFCWLSRTAPSTPTAHPCPGVLQGTGSNFTSATGRQRRCK